MTPKRLFVLVLLAFSAALVFVPSAAAGNFDEEKMGCAGEAPAECPTGTVGQPYGLTIYLVPPNGERGEDFGCATFHVTSGTFPPGLSISDEGYVIGTPTQAGTYRFYFTVRLDREAWCASSCGSKCSSDDEFIIKINPGIPKLTIGPEAAPVGTVGSPYSLPMQANLPDAKSWSIAGGSLPAGLSISSSSGVISGTPTTAGTSTFTVKAEINAQQSDTKTLTIDVRNALVASARGFDSDTRTAQTEVGLPFSARVSATGGQGPYTWALAGSLPEGLEFDPATGVLAGITTLSGTYRFTLTVTDSERRTQSYQASISVARRLAVATKRLKNALVGRLYRAKLASIGGVAPVSWRIKTGPLPRGIRFDRATGSFAGRARTPGTWVITVESTDALRVKVRANVVLVVKKLAKRS